jgi:hypothetical protein
MSDIVIRMTIDAGQLQSALNDLKGKLTDIGAKDIDLKTGAAEKKIRSLRDSVAMWGLAIQGAVNAFRMVGSAISSALAPASEFEQLRLRLNALYQDTDLAAQAFERFQEIATQTPATLQEIVEGGAALKAYGMDAENTLASVSDLAAYMGLNVVEAAQAVGRAFAGGAGAADVLRERGVLELVKSFKGIEDLTDLTLPEFREALIETMQDPAAGISGTAITLAASFSGSISNMKDALTRFAAYIGEKVTPALASLARFVGQAVEWFMSLDGTMQALLVTLPLATAAWGKLVAAQVTATTITGGLTAAITAAAAAVKGFLVTIGPVGWVLLGATAAVTAYSLAFKGAKKEVKDLGDATAQAEAEAEESVAAFGTMSDRLIELKKQTSLTADEQGEMSALISTLNDQYGDYLGNLDLEKGSYEDIAAALKDVNEQLIMKALSDAFREKMAAQAAVVADLTHQLNLMGGEYESTAEKLRTVPEIPEGVDPYGGGADYLAQQRDQKNKLMEQTRADLEAARAELAKLGKAYNAALGEAMAAGGGDGGDGGASPGAALEKSYQTLMERLRAYQRTELEKIAVEYDEHMAVIVGSTEEGSEERMQAIDLLNEWRSDEEQKVADKAIAEEEKATRAKQATIAAYYEEVKFADASYYEWKKAQILAEVEATSLGEEAKALLVEQRLQELEDDLRRATEEAPAPTSRHMGLFWQAVGFDPDSPEDQAKVRAAEQSFRRLQSTLSNVVSMALDQNRSRRDEELASIEETAERERWSQERLLQNKKEIAAKYEKEDKKLRRIQKGISITQAIINTAEAATKALTMGPLIGPIMAALMTALGAAQISLIASQKFAQGGLFRGEGGPRDDRNIIAVSDGEYIVNAEVTRRYKPILDALNFGQTGGTLLPEFAYASGGIVSGGVSLADVAKKLDILNLNLVKKEMAVTVQSGVGVETVIRKSDKQRPRMERRGYNETQSI